MGMSKKTKSLIEEYASKGFEIIIGNNPRLLDAKKWRNYECVRLCLTNSKFHGYSVRTVWAVRRLVRKGDFKLSCSASRFGCETMMIQGGE